jgi:CRISPR-associated protein (TIGR02710 family)
MAEKTILLCTVGGSPEPIVKAIESRKPDHVVFVCTGPSGTNPGSRVQIEGPVPPPPPARPQPHDPRTIPERTELARERWEILEVPPDDPDGAFWLVRGKLRELRARKEWAGATIWMDYTGGTKSMTAALLAASIGADEATRPQLVTGERRDLVQVQPGTEQAAVVALDAMLADRVLAQAEALWSHHAYGAAAALLAPLAKSLAVAEHAPEELRTLVTRALRASELLAAWDRLDHATALQLLCEHRLAATKLLRPYDQPLRKLASPAQRLPLLLMDLWHNAGRCAARGAFDDAVARCYRLVEATAQHLLHTRYGIDTGKLDPGKFLDRVPEKEREAWRTREVAGLVDAWRLFGWLAGKEDPIVRALETARADGKPMAQLQEWLRARNYSLFAHGFEPVGREGWEAVRRWMERYWLDEIWPCLGCRDKLDQLPTSLSGLT